MRTESPFSLSQHRILPYVAFNKDAFPNCRHLPAGPNHSACQNKPSFFSRESQAQYQAFVRFAVVSNAALSAIALNQDLAFGTFHSGRALLF
jgi:hypothetical protein